MSAKEHLGRGWLTGAATVATATVAVAVAVGAVGAVGLTTARALADMPASSPAPAAPAAPLLVDLRWVKAYDAETWDDVRTGLGWSLSYLGARLPAGSLDAAVQRDGDGRRFRLDLARVGFDAGALAALRVVAAALAASDEQRRAGAVDLGRFLVLALHSPWHYYRITGAEPTLGEFRRKHGLDRFDRFPVVNSNVAVHERMLSVKACAAVGPPGLAFLAEEGRGSIAAGTFRAESYEAAALLPNGQLRFAVYDRRGRLAASSPAELSEAGKPSKCLWCHESNLVTLYEDTPNLPGYMTDEGFAHVLDTCGDALRRYRATLASDIDFARAQDHTKSELLYISFMEPSLLRLANEWGQPPERVAAALADAPAHVYPEFPFLGRLYRRADADARAPYRGLAVPDSVREANPHEPNLFGRRP